MKLEDFTKEELIYYIRRRYALNADDVEFDALVYRSEQAMNAEMQHNDAANDCLQEYIDLLKPHEGQRMNDVPLGTIKAAAEAMKRRETYLKKAGNEQKKYEKAQRRMDELLNRTATQKLQKECKAYVRP